MEPKRSSCIASDVLRMNRPAVFSETKVDPICHSFRSVVGRNLHCRELLRKTCIAHYKKNAMDAFLDSEPSRHMALESTKSH
jgi:hypothetical protein